MRLALVSLLYFIFAGNLVLCQQNDSSQIYGEQFEKFKVIITMNEYCKIVFKSTPDSPLLQKVNNKSYIRPYDELRSYKAYEENHQIVNEHNKDYDSGKSSFRLTTNTMADMVSYIIHMHMCNVGHIIVYYCLSANENTRCEVCLDLWLLGITSGSNPADWLKLLGYAKRSVNLTAYYLLFIVPHWTALLASA